MSKSGIRKKLSQLLQQTDAFDRDHVMVDADADANFGILSWGDNLPTLRRNKDLTQD